MENSNSIEKTDGDQTKSWGQAILRAKTALIKPYSKYTEEGVRPRTPNGPYSILTKQQQTAIQRSATPLFLDVSTLSTATGEYRRFRQRHSDTIPRSLLRAGSISDSGNQYPYITAEAYTSELSEQYDGCTIDAYPKWHPNRAGERTLPYLHEHKPTVRHVSIDMHRRPLTARSGQIIFDHGRPNDGYYLPRYGDRATWFDSEVPLNRRHILESIEPKTSAEYEKEKSLIQQRYHQAKKHWPHLTEYEEEYIVPTVVQPAPRTDLERAKRHIAQHPTRHSSIHNQLAASAVCQGRTLVNDSSLIVKC